MIKQQQWKVRMMGLFFGLCLCGEYLAAQIEPSSKVQTTASDLQSASLNEDPSLLIGATIEQIFQKFGPPQSVYSVRGQEAWQDDVVFVYHGFDIYWFKNRVWQIACTQGYGISIGESIDKVLAILGQPLNRQENALIYQLPTKAWPVRLRIGVTEQGTVQSLYVYRADF
jgi:hypothetical protein